MKTCCGFRLSTAGLVVGLFYSVIALFITIAGLEYLYDFLTEDRYQYSPWLIATTILIIVFGIADLISSILLIVAVLKKRPSLLKPWLIIGIAIIIFIFIFLLYYVYILIFIAITKARFDYGLLVEIVLIALLLVFQIYLWKSILYLYKEIQNKIIEHNITLNTVRLYPTFDDSPK